jgi:2-polyprenyl-3-methyl-5-hydroxy-6-metoxy-1,4-benzoquinol methylase
MLEIGEPEVSVDELMQRVRQEVERRRLEGRFRGTSSPVLTDDEVAASWQAIDEAITAAGSSTVVGVRLPPMTQMRGWKRKLAVPLARVILRAAQLVTRDQSAFNQLILELVRLLSNSIHDRLTSADRKISALTDGLARASSQTRFVSELVDARARTASEMEGILGRVRALEETAAGLSHQVARLDDTTGRLDDTTGRLDAAISEAIHRMNAIHEDIASVRVDAQTRIVNLTRAIDTDQQRTQHLRTQSLLQERRISMLLEELRRRPTATAPVNLTAAVDDTLEHLSDTFYLSFEDQFRGTREDIKQRTRVYLQVIVDAGAGTEDRPVLDIGCGRGEWLEVLKENRLVGRGIDLNQAIVAEGRDRGLEVTEGSALEHLQALSAASLGAMTGLHVLEHLDFATVIKILDECSRVLQPGGVAIFETPNPKNLVVGACQFYVDPTHRRPLHPDTMAFIAEARGLNRVYILPLHPVDDGRRLAEADSPIAKVLNEYLFGPQDFAVVGYRA